MGSKEHKKDQGFEKILPGGMEEKLSIPWERTKDQVWDDLLLKVEDRPQGSIIFRRSLWPKFAVAASLVILMGITGVLRFYKQTVECLAGEHLSLVLPDGSNVELNAGSELAYFPYWWRFSRHLELDGEAFFNVRKGKRFEVVSERGKTRVLGTSFNVLSRDDQYQVACISGNVKVVSRDHKNSVILEPNQLVILDESGELLVQDSEESFRSFNLRENSFIFTTVPLNEVLREIERQYNVSIDTPEIFDYSYTGNFERFESVEMVLNLVCKPFGLIFVELSENHYRIEKE